MGAVLAGDQIQLDRIEQTIASIKARPALEQARMRGLLKALEAERTHILRCSRPVSSERLVVRRPPRGGRTAP
jgi:hypothetical protein